jgi:PAS domain-containing protein
MSKLFRRFGRRLHGARHHGSTEGDRHRPTHSLADDLHERSIRTPDAQKILQIADQVVLSTPATRWKMNFVDSGPGRSRSIVFHRHPVGQWCAAIDWHWPVVCQVNRVRDSEEKYRNLIDTANDAILVIDTRRVVLEGNNQASELLGISDQLGMPEFYSIPRRGFQTTSNLWHRMLPGLPAPRSLNCCGRTERPCP